MAAVVIVSWLLAEFMVVGPLVFGALVFVGLEQALGGTATGALAGAVAGAAIGLAPEWTRARFWLGATTAAAAGFGVERFTGFFASQFGGDAAWAAFSLAAVAGPMVESTADSHPAPGVRPLRVAASIVVGAALGAVAPRGDAGPADLRTTFALAHVVLCCLLRRTIVVEEARRH